MILKGLDEPYKKDHQKFAPSATVCFSLNFLTLGSPKFTTTTVTPIFFSTNR